MQLRATANLLQRSVDIKVEKVVNGKAVNFFSGKFEKHTDFAQCSKRLAVAEESILELVDLYRRTAPQAVTLNLTADAPAEGCYNVRGETESLATSVSYPTLQEALASCNETQVCQWDNTYHACNLDIDFDEDATPSPRQLLNFAELLQPQPFAFSLSKSGGLHVYYTKQDGYSADELAAVAAYHFLRRFPQATFEFLHRTRGSSEFNFRQQSTEIGIIKSLLLDGSDTDNAAYLESRSIKPGTRLAHTECPVNPSARAKGNSGPVIVYEDHYFCYVCERDGRKCGSNTPGYFPFSAVSGGRVNSQIHRCVMNFVHWGHAQQVLRNQIADLQLARRIYSTLLKLKHGDDPRIPLVFTAGEPNGLVRYAGHWRDYDGNPVKIEKNSAILATLPHCMELTKSYAIHESRVAMEWLSQTGDQSIRGYPAVTPIRGYHFTQWQQLPEHKVYVVLKNPELEDKRQPRYLPVTDRLSEQEAWERLATIFPKIDKTLIYFLLAGRGCVEHHSGISPMLFLTGPTGSGKTGLVEVAAAIAGDAANTIKCNQDTDRFDNKILTAKSRGSFVLLDEFFKNARKAKLSEVEAMEELLNFSPSTLIYLIHVGAVPLGDLPFFIWADTKIPPDVKRHEQIGRRVYHYHLEDELEWKETLPIIGGKPNLLRKNCTDEILAACNTILSIVIDWWFTQPITDLSEVAETLGVGRLRDAEVIDEKRCDIRELFEQVCNAPAIKDDSIKRRFSKRGIKLAKDNGTCPVYAAFLTVQNERERGTTACEAVQEVSLKKVLGLKYPTTMEVRKHGTLYGIRFRATDQTIDCVNEELLLTSEK